MCSRRFPATCSPDERATAFGYLKRPYSARKNVKKDRVILNYSENIPILIRHPAVFLSRRSYIFVLSHMRSYSSALCHILGSHSEIDGYSEMHQRYLRPIDLLRLRTRVFRSLDTNQLGGRFVLDKILHNEYGMSIDIINRPNVFPIFLIRRPFQTISSILEMGRSIDVEWYSDCEATTAYYESRLTELARISREINSRALAIKAESMIGRTDRVLAAIGSFLNLERPLTQSYRIFPHTGEVGWGDSSSAILEGRIVRRPPAERHVKIEPHSLSRAERTYAECLKQLKRCCNAV